jgi:hypothetical protein
LHNRPLRHAANFGRTQQKTVWQVSQSVPTNNTESVGRLVLPDHIESFNSFNGRLRDKCLNVHQFLSLEDVRKKIEAWHRDYKDHRVTTARSGT